MIVPRWTAFRLAFALPGAVADSDGMLAWPLDHMRINGFANTIGLTAFAYPPDRQPSDPATFTATCNAGRTDTADGTTYDWYLGQRTDDALSQVLTVTQPDLTRSGSILISTNTLTKRLIPSNNFVLPDSLANLFRRVDLYVQRKSDKAIQYLSLAVALGGYQTPVG